MADKAEARFLSTSKWVAAAMITICAMLMGSTSVPVAFAQLSPNYFVSSSSGSDLNSGTDSLHPWQTLSKVSTIVRSLHAGQSVLFKRGDTWNASSTGPMLNLPSGLNGTPLTPIVFASYGSGPAPVFDGNKGQATACFFAHGIGTGSTPIFSYITINGFECRNTSQYGVLFYQNQGGNVGMPGIVVENMKIHHTGPGAYAGAIQGRTSASNETCTNSPPAGPAPCDDGNYRNQLMFLDENSIGGGVQFINNTVDTCGGHNCIQVQGDTKGALEQGNTCFGWVHNCLDVKVSQNALIKNNVCFGNGSGAGACYYYENGYLAGGGSITWQGNVAYSAPNGIQCESAGSNYLTHCNVYNNTLFLGDDTSAIVSASTSNIAFDVRNNIFDTSAPLYVCNANNTNWCGDVVIWDYNNDGGLSGGVSNLLVKGPHDQMNVDPMYVNTRTNNFQLQKSPEIGAGQPGLTPGNSNIGAY